MTGTSIAGKGSGQVTRKTLRRVNLQTAGTVGIDAALAVAHRYWELASLPTA